MRYRDDRSVALVVYRNQHAAIRSQPAQASVLYAPCVALLLRQYWQQVPMRPPPLMRSSFYQMTYKTQYTPKVIHGVVGHIASYVAYCI